MIPFVLLCLQPPDIAVGTLRCVLPGSTLGHWPKETMAIDSSALPTQRMGLPGADS